MLQRRLMSRVIVEWHSVVERSMKRAVQEFAVRIGLQAPEDISEEGLNYSEDSGRFFNLYRDGESRLFLHQNSLWFFVMKNKNSALFRYWLWWANLVLSLFMMVIFFVGLIKPLPVKPEGTVIFHSQCLFVCPTWFSTLHKLT